MNKTLLAFYSEKTGKFYKLIETHSWPALQISGILMHRIEGMDPKADAIAKVKALGKISGSVLDICTGLGYTAILLAEIPEVKKVVTIEKDPEVIRVAKQNQASQALFKNPKIELIIADAFQLLDSFPSESFDAILHDPPRISVAGELYSEAFYRKLFRVLKPRGKLFHYTGIPGKHSGKRYLKGIKERLFKAGFSKIAFSEDALGFIAVKQRKNSNFF